MADTFRLRVTYGKTGRLRFLSHLEVMRACERSVRRAQLAYAVTQGFNPRMKAGFGPALPVGTAGLAEAYEVWLTRLVPPDEALSRLRESSPEDLAPKEARYVPESAGAVGASLTMAEYEVMLDGPDVGRDPVRSGLEAIAAEGGLACTRKGKTKIHDLAVCLPKEPTVGEIDGRIVVTVTVHIGPWGSLRPEALVAEALARSSVQGAVISVTRTRLDPEGSDA